MAIVHMSAEPIRISLTDFVDFSIKVGPPKLTKVNELRRRGNYSPATDFWKPLRDALVDLHESGRMDRRQLDAFLKTVSDGKKVSRYTDACAGYKSFLGRKRIDWFASPQAIWVPNRLKVRVKPELGLTIDGHPHIVKLYFKNDKLSKQRVELVTYLMRDRLKKSAPAGARFCVLDIAHAKLHHASENGGNLFPLLMGEAAAFVAMWESLDA